MLALPPAPAPAKPRMLLVATGLVCAALTMVIGTMLGVYLHFRELNGNTTTKWLPKGVAWNGIAANMMLFMMIFATVTAQWAVYAITRGDRRNTYAALGLTAVFGVLVINAQVFLWQQAKLPIATTTPFGPVVYAITGLATLLVVTAIAMTIVVVFRTLGGRTAGNDTQVVSAHAMYWHFLTVAMFAVWYFVYHVK